MKQAYRLEGCEQLDLHHAYRAMAWLGEVVGESTANPAGLRTTKDLIEEELFARRRDLFSSLEVVFFDTTSLYFEGAGGGEPGSARPQLDRLEEMELAKDGKRFLLRSEAAGVTGKVFQAVGVALPPHCPADGMRPETTTQKPQKPGAKAKSRPCKSLVCRYLRLATVEVGPHRLEREPGRKRHARRDAWTRSIQARSSPVLHVTRSPC